MITEYVIIVIPFSDRADDEKTDIKHAIKAIEEATNADANVLDLATDSRIEFVTAQIKANVRGTFA